MNKTEKRSTGVETTEGERTVEARHCVWLTRRLFIEKTSSFLFCFCFVGFVAVFVRKQIVAHGTFTLLY